MQILGYATGPISCRAAFTSDFAIPATMPIQQLVNNVENERPSMDVRPGMRHKYMPLRFDPATGAHLVGGRYLFDSWDDVVDYVRFTSSELEFEPGVKFWDRQFFLNVDKHAWYVVGAHDFTPMASTHYVNRLERFTYAGADIRGRLAAVWPTVSEAAATQRLASAWLLFQPDEHQIGIVTVADRVEGSDDADTASRSLAALEHSKSLARFLPRELAPEKVFDRTSLNLSLWLPRSRDAGGAPSAFPTFPVHPVPEAAAPSAQGSLPAAPAVVRERPGGERMRAIVLEKFGGLDSLVYTDIPKPLPKDGEVVIQVRGFGLNHAELHMRRGEWAEAAEVSGIECVGIVDSCPGGARSYERFAMLEQLGAAAVELESKALAADIAETKQIDAVLDLVGNSTILDSLDMLRRGGTACLAGWLGGLDPIGDFNPLLRMASGVNWSFFGSFMFGTPGFPLSDVPLQDIAAQVAAGRLEAAPSRVFGFDEIHEAHRVMEAGAAGGKMVVVMD